MPKASDNTTPKKNTTEERLRATPFDNVSELDAEAKAIRLSVWRQFTQAQVINELLTKPENSFIVEEWKAGLIAFYGAHARERIFKIFSEGRGLKLELNKEYTQSLGDQEVRLIEGVIRASIEGYGSLYLRAKSLLGECDSNPDAMKALAEKKIPKK
jgi:hypothetical protein